MTKLNTSSRFAINKSSGEYILRAVAAVVDQDIRGAHSDCPYMSSDYVKPNSMVVRLRLF
eukprot:scaffold189400_cov34-Prasinocladus_malaysianus.AAC.1